MICAIPTVFRILAITVVMVVAPALAQAPTAIAPLQSDGGGGATARTSRAVDLVICLDVSGSMKGLIDAARQNLWSIVNDMAMLRPQPELRVALLTYGNPLYGPQAGFVSVQTGLTSDLDLVSEKLFALGTNGGDEYVARVVQRSLTDLEWSADPKALKLIFVAGNEGATQDPEVDAAAMAKAAIQEGILVNTIFCGDQGANEAEGWRQVARLADGKFAAIEQDQAVVIETPFDKQLGDLSAALNATSCPYGPQGQRWAANQVAQDQNAGSLNSAAVAQRCVTKAGSLYNNAAMDLVDACKDPKFELASVKKEDLPENLRALTLEQLKQHVDDMAKKRAVVSKQVSEIARKREAYVAEERKKMADKGDKLFEEAILELVRDQARSRGFERREPPKPEVEQPATAEPKEEAEDQSTSKGQKADVDPRFEEILRRAVVGYEKFHRVTGEPRVPPTMCHMPGPFIYTSEASREHGGKLYLLYARHADGTKYIEEGQPAKIGQTLIKESWQRIKGEPQGRTEAHKRYPGGLTMKDGDYDYHAGDSIGLFVMHKLDPKTPGTDQGWIYGTIDKHGKVTGAGRMASCIKCHEDADFDRRFGLN